MGRTKILFFMPNLMHGGAERVLLNLVNHMNADKFEITVQTMFDVGIYKDQLAPGVRYIGGFPWYFHGNTKVFKIFSPEQLFMLYIKEDYDIVVSYLEGPSARVVGGGPVNKNTKLVCWIHGEQETRARAEYVFRSGIEAEKCYKRFDRIVCVSETVKNDFMRLFPDAAKPVVLYNTVESERIRKKSKESITDVSFSKDEINLISVAKLQQVKGYDRLLNVLSRLREQDSTIPFHLYLLGIGEEKENLERQAYRLGLADRVSFLGFKENPYKYVKAADLYVCSSRREGFSTAVTEALIVGTPVVSTRCSGAEELLGPQNEYGIVTDNDEDSLYLGIKRMISDRQMLAAYREKARERGAMFSTEETVHAVEKMLTEVLSQ